MDSGSEKLRALEVITGTRFPEDYVRFLLGMKNATRITARDSPGMSWEFATLDRSCWKDEHYQTLDKKLLINSETCTYVSQLGPITEGMVRDPQGVSVVGSDEFLDLNRLRNAIAIAQCNTDVMFLDPADNYSVWVFWVTTNNVEKVASSFGEWLKHTEINREPGQAELNDASTEAMYLGKWKPIECETLSDAVVAATSTLILKESAVSEEIDMFGDLVPGKWLVVDKNAKGYHGIRIVDEDGDRIYWVKDHSDNQMTLLSPGSEHEMIYEKVDA